MNIIITLKTKLSNRYYDISLPDNRSINLLVKDISDLINHHNDSFLPDNKISRMYSKMKNEYLHPEETLKTSGIMEGDIIYVD